MTDIEFTLNPGEPNEARVTLAQLLALEARLDEFENPVWHLNACGCCIALHDRENNRRGYVIGRDGGADWVEVREPEPAYRLWVNAERTLLVRQWKDDGRVEVAERETPAQYVGSADRDERASVMDRQSDRGKDLKLLDLFCGAGGAAEGYRRAGFEVVGVDIRPQERYPFSFYQGGALAWLEAFVCGGEWPDGESYDVVHASPPCPAYSMLATIHPERRWPRLIASVRELLEQAGVHYVIENVEGAPLASAPTLDGRFGVVLCGSMFGLGVERGYLRRHRVFETSVPVAQPLCRHDGYALGVYGHGGEVGKHRMLYRAEAASALGIGRPMNHAELADAIPPAYTEHIGRFLVEALGGVPVPSGQMTIDDMIEVE